MGGVEVGFGRACDLDLSFRRVRLTETLMRRAWLLESEVKVM